MYKNGIESYRKTNVITADPGKLILMCYEGALHQLKVGKEKIIENDYEGKNIALSKAHEIINELLCSLDYEKGAIIAENLDALYNYMLNRIGHADMKKDIRAIDEVIGLLSELLSAWEEVYNKQDMIKNIETDGFEEARKLQAVGHISV